MKKRILLLALVLTIFLVACGKSEAAKNVDALIEAIGTVTLSSEKAIMEAEAAYNALTQEEKNQLDHYETLNTARGTLDELLAQKKAEEEALRIEQVKQVAAETDAVISAIGTVTLESEEAITSARASYDALDEETKDYVTLLSDLETAEAELNQIKVQTVSTLISEIGTVTLDSGKAIETASEMYDALLSDTQAMVENASVLAEATQTYNELLKNHAESLLSKLREDRDEINGISFYYASTFPYYASQGYWGADVRCFVLPYLGVQGDNEGMRLVCDYTSDNWVFFKKITFAVDEKRYSATFNYYDVVRDNAWGKIWEYVDIEVRENEFELLEEIANSEKTIVRFEGDNYYDDFVVSEKDKKAIKDMLLLYEYLSNK